VNSPPMSPIDGRAEACTGPLPHSREARSLYSQ
jgi:hypothetical protein